MLGNIRMAGADVFVLECLKLLRCAEFVGHCKGEGFELPDFGLGLCGLCWL